MNLATDEHVDVQSVIALHVSPGWDHQQRARKIAYAARTNMPLRTLSVDKRIGVAEALPVERHSPEQCVVHCLFVQVGILRIVRSEEHTSELQSLRHLVCRLLL